MKNSYGKLIFKSEQPEKQKNLIPKLELYILFSVVKEEKIDELMLFFVLFSFLLLFLFHR